jgi:ATP-dependent protease HslVU (ClpYQ) peptidase subunit
MTVVVAYTNETDCWMYYDSASSDDDMVLAARTPKAIIHAGNGIIGAAGSWRVINLLSKLKARKVSPETIVSMLKEVKGEDESIKDMEILCVWPGRPLVIIQGDFAMIEMESPYLAIGSGSPYALGYLEGCEDIGPNELSYAVEVAIKYSPSVAGPVKNLYCGSK